MAQQAAVGEGGRRQQHEAGADPPAPVASWGTTGSGPGQFRFRPPVAVGPDGTVDVGTLG